MWRWRWSDEVRLWARGDVSPCGQTKAPSVRGLSSASETGGENLRFLFSPSVMTYGHDTSLSEGGKRRCNGRKKIVVRRQGEGTPPYAADTDGIL